MDGATGPTGANGVSGREIVRVSYPETQSGFAGVVVFPAGAAFAWTVSCPAGKQVIGGGCYMNNSSFRLYSNAPSDADGNPINGWTCLWVNASGNGILAAQMRFATSAVCAVTP